MSALEQALRIIIRARIRAVPRISSPRDWEKRCKEGTSQVIHVGTICYDMPDASRHASCKKKGFDGLGLRVVFVCLSRRRSYCLS
jgi:hypothetical protein